MNSQFTQRRECRAAAFQYLYAWSVNQPAALGDDLRLFFEHLEQPRDYYAFAEELIHGAIEHVVELDSHIKGLAHNWEFERIAKIDLAILRLAMFEMLHRKDIPPSFRSTRRLTSANFIQVRTLSDLSMECSIE